jgi:hypothetical protein
LLNKLQVKEEIEEEKVEEAQPVITLGKGGRAGK